MTRFKMEITGALGKFWEDNAKKEIALAVEKANKNAVVDCNGAISWKSNGNYLPDDFCEKLEYANYDFSREATREAREFQTAKFFENYRNAKRERSEEEIFELRANFDKGTVVVDIITGEKFTV